MAAGLIVLVVGWGPATKGPESHALRKGGTLVLVANAAPPGSPDPQVNYNLREAQFLIITHDGLVGFRRAGGRSGTQLVPDLANSIPKPTDGGRTFTFTLRSGIKFSDGRALTGKDVKATFERLFKLGDSPNAGTWYSAIAGGDACVRSPAACSLAKGIVVKGNTVTFHLARPDGEFLHQLAVPFAFILPAGTPAHHLDIPPPGTGPYKWVEYAPDRQMKVIRNPYFKVWSKAAQPAGLPDEIVERFGLSVEAEVTAVERGQADWMFDSVPADRLAEVSTKYRSQVHVDPVTETDYFAFNTRIPPFNNLKARQAVNYATDRGALVKIFGGPNLATPTCQVLPPRFPGYKRYCPYTTSPGGGRWKGPNMRKALQLVAQSRTKGAHVIVNTDTRDVQKGWGLYFVDLLNRLGYKASLQALSPAIQYPYVQNSKNQVQFAWSAWSQDYPAASDFLRVLLGCGSFHPESNASPNIAQFCNKAIDAEMARASTTGLTNPTKANRIWADIDRRVTDQAPWVAFLNRKSLNFVSKRLKGFTFSPQFYFLLDQASVR